ncbi:MAG: DUF2298 domain-containing protein [Chloroflexi bacterium]|nr:DUF2298 domain-containing protein [Chloroflexota bacterium]MDA1239940.1 DUF2298 domain-containing protein [Chloroflexota bacterium]MQC25648.1 hypothetical protein [Chloroflexota bacterium]MQC48078.1 hypothetical protein [Chloroflexota bacterium]
MSESIAWLLVLLLVAGGGALPSALLFGRLDSRGLPYALPVGMAVLGLTTWLAGALVAPYGTPLVVAALLGLGGWSAALAWRQPALLRSLDERARLAGFTSIGFVALFALILFARTQAPDAWGTEKPMDLALLVAVHRAESLPPPDPWLSGERVAYYHLGHTTADAIGRLSGNGPDVTFNLAVATAGAAAGMVAAGLAMDVLAMAGGARRRSKVVAATVAGGVLLTVGPLVGLIDLLSAHGIGGAGTWGWLGVDRVPLPAGATHGVPDGFWWWWNTTRVLPGTISEYPGFTLTLGDPHAHLLALPLALTTVALALVAFEGMTPLTWRRWLRRPHELVLVALIFAALVMTNPWDATTYGGVWGLAAFVSAKRVGWPLAQALFIAVRWAAMPAGLAVLLAYPFLSGLHPPPTAVAPVIREHSDPVRWLLVWLPPLLPMLVAAVCLELRPARVRTALVIAIVPVALWLGTVVLLDETAEVTARGAGWVTLALLVVLLAWLGATAAAADARRDRGLAAALALATAGLGVILLTELVMVDDAFAGRFNSVFKFWFHAWALIAVAVGALAAIAVERFGDIEQPAWLSAPAVRALAGATAVLLVLCALVTPAIAVSRAREGQVRGLDATAYLVRVDPGLWAAVQWARVELDPREAVLVQAVGDSYSRGNMLAAATGVPTLLGWPGHQRQWRHAPDEAARRQAVEMLYLEGATDAGLATAQEWGITHVYVGFEEISSYGTGVIGRFAAWPLVLHEGMSRIFEVPQEMVP